MKSFGLTASIEDPRIPARKVFSLISSELSLVEDEFERQSRSNIQVIAYIGEYLRESGGKRIRPALSILSNYAVGGDASAHRSIQMATVMEFLHTATLVHDDIIDNAQTRRNHPSVNSRFGNQTAVLMGDWLYMSAFETSLAERSLKILDILTGVTRKMTEGELIQLTMLGRTDIDEEKYFDILKRKTAYLFSACCEIGGIMGGCDEATEKSLRDYGMNLGIAFQLADDLLDFTSEEQLLGKASGADLLEGKLTLPLILLLKEKPQMKTVLQRIMQEGSYKEFSRDRLLDELNEINALEETRNRAYHFADAAQSAIKKLSESKYQDALYSLPSYIIERKK
jgi:octaprenyl-diphosphate synthase